MLDAPEACPRLPRIPRDTPRQQDRVPQLQEHRLPARAAHGPRGAKGIGHRSFNAIADGNFRCTRLEAATLGASHCRRHARCPPKLAPSLPLIPTDSARQQDRLPQLQAHRESPLPAHGPRGAKSIGHGSCKVIADHKSRCPRLEAATLGASHCRRDDRCSRSLPPGSPSSPETRPGNRIGDRNFKIID